MQHAWQRRASWWQRLLVPMLSPKETLLCQDTASSLAGKSGGLHARPRSGQVTSAERLAPESLLPASADLLCPGPRQASRLLTGLGAKRVILRAYKLPLLPA